MAKKTIELVGIVFTVKGHTKVHDYKSRTLWDCYERPSHIKELIWCKWYRKLLDMGFHDISVSTYNAQMFTIIAYNENYLVRIYPTHNDIYYVD